MFTVLLVFFLSRFSCQSFKLAAVEPTSSSVCSYFWCLLFKKSSCQSENEDYVLKLQASVGVFLWDQALTLQ